VLFIGTANPYTNVPGVPGTEAFWGGTEVFMGTFIAPLSAPPQNLIASDGDVIDELIISWDASPGAVSYKIFRSETADLDDAKVLATVDHPVTSYDDNSAVSDCL